MKVWSQALPRLLLLASLLLMVFAYGWIWVQAVRELPSPTVGAMWGLAVTVYFILFALLLLLHAFSDALWPEFPNLLTQWTERVGISRFEPWGVVAAVVAIAFSSIYVPALSFVPLLGGIGFLAMWLFISPHPVLPEETRVLYHPLTVPEDQLTVPFPPDVPQPEQLPEGVEIREYAWQVEWAPHEGVSQQMWVSIVLQRLQQFREKNPYGKEPPPQVIDFHEFVTNGITGEVLHAAHHFQEETRRRAWTPFHEICNVLAFVQSIPYSHDEESIHIAEYFRYPIETLADATGDCEDTTILAASLLKTLGHEVVVLLVLPRDREPGHAAIGVAVYGFPFSERLVQGRYLYCETTQEGWHVGEVPDALVGREIQVRPI